jgi:hypothetical protein
MKKFLFNITFERADGEHVDAGPLEMTALGESDLTAADAAKQVERELEVGKLGFARWNACVMPVAAIANIRAVFVSSWIVIEPA